jgi:DNA-binding MarR family transcriptional regulator
VVSEGAVRPDDDSPDDAGPDQAALRAAAAALVELGSLLIRLRRRDLSLTAEAVLVALDRVGPGRVGDLAALAGVSQPTMTELLGRLDRDGLVARDAHPEDRRAVHVSISQQGRAFLHQRRSERVDQLVCLFDGLNDHDAAALADALPALRHILAAGQGGGNDR